MDEFPTQEELNAAGEAAVQAFLSTLNRPELSTGRYVVLVETLDADGERLLYQASSDGQTAWDSLGLLQYAVNHLEDD